MEPFDFGIQSHNGDGRMPILLRYSGQGRREEIHLTPEKHGKRLVQRLTNGVNLAKIAFADDGVLWNWTTWGRDFSSADLGEKGEGFENGGGKTANEGTPSLRVFFHLKAAALGERSRRPFSPDEAFVSVSRREIFMAHRVMEDYITARYRQLLLDPDADGPEPAIDYSAGTYSFRFGALCGTLIPDDREISDDILLFAGLKEPLEQVAEYLTDPPSPFRVQFDADGVRLRLPIRENLDGVEF